MELSIQAFTNMVVVSPYGHAGLMADQVNSQSHRLRTPVLVQLYKI